MLLIELQAKFKINQVIYLTCKLDRIKLFLAQVYSNLENELTLLTRARF